MTTRKLTHWQKVLVGFAAVLLVTASAVAMNAHAAQMLAAAPAAQPQGVLIFKNETGSAVAGLQLEFAMNPVQNGKVYAFSSFVQAEVVQCEGCVWVKTTLAPGEELRVVLNQPYALSALKCATWYAEARSLFRSIWKARHCAVL